MNYLMVKCLLISLSVYSIQGENDMGKQCLHWSDSIYTHINCSHQSWTSANWYFTGNTDIETEAISLNLSHNSFSMLSEKMFSSKRLCKTLKKLDLYNCNVNKIHSKAFDNLIALRVLNCSYNNIQDLNPQLFRNTKLLDTLLFNRNNLSRIETGLFNNLTRLDFIDLSYNRIEYISNDSFGNNHNLTSLILNNNRLTYMDALANIPSLKNLILNENSFLCDCRMSSFLAWLRENGVKETYGKCNKPTDLKNIFFSSVTNSEKLNCHINITKITYVLDKSKTYMNVSCVVYSGYSSELKSEWFFEKILPREYIPIQNGQRDDLVLLNGIRHYSININLTEYLNYDRIVCKFDINDRSVQNFLNIDEISPQLISTDSPETEMSNIQTKITQESKDSNVVWIVVIVGVVFGVIIVSALTVAFIRRKNRMGIEINLPFCKKSIMTANKTSTQQSEDEVNSLYGFKIG